MLAGCRSFLPPTRHSSRVIERNPFQFNKRSQLFIRTHNKTLSVAAMCVSGQRDRDTPARGRFQTAVKPSVQSAPEYIGNRAMAGMAGTPTIK
jgi:hypothetical protein